MIPIKEYEDNKYLFMATRNGIVKKTPIQDYENIRKTGLAAINLREDDKLIEVKVTDNTEDIFLFTKFGQCIRFNESDVRSTGRTTMGVIGMNPCSKRCSNSNADGINGRFCDDSIIKRTWKVYSYR